MTHTAREAIQILEHATAVVITVYVSRNDDKEKHTELLDDTVHMFVREVADPAAICLSVDGPGIAVDIAKEISRAYGTSLVISERNRGKFAAVQNGVMEMLQNPDYRYFAAVDQDGDHFANDMLNFVRSGENVQSITGSERLVILGERASRHRPLGFLRGEQEALADAILLDALKYHAAVSNQPLNLTFANAVNRYPDFHAGYKLFSRQTAVDVFSGPPNLAGCGEDAYYRHAVEAVMIVESLAQGAILASVTRHTFDEQPVSVFADFNLTRLTADLILWPCKRLGVPGRFVRQWLSNHMSRLLLGTLQPEGRDELLAIQKLVLDDYGVPAEEYASHDIVRPRFI